MLILPIPRRPNWSNPPFVTLGIILICTFVYFVFQSGDARQQQKAWTFYSQSVLPKIEFPAYLAELEKRGDVKKRPTLAELEKRSWVQLAFLMQMEGDEAFMARLRANQIVLPDAPAFGTWSLARKQYEALREKGSFTERYGFKPTEARPITWLTHMFMHGSPDHLLGNMIFLFIVGYIVEEALGHRRYLAYYLLAGLGAALFDFVFAHNRTVVGIGASGAVSGVMAMFVVLFGMQRIRFFYWVFVYFNFFMAPAIIMLPVWILKELLEMRLVGGNINYIAHIGGLVTGAGLASYYRWRHPNRALPEIERPPATIDAPENTLAQGMGRVDLLVKALHFDQALDALAPIATTNKRDEDVLTRYYNLSRRFPASPHYHQAAALVFNLPERQHSANALATETFQEYMRLARPAAHFSRSQLAILAQRMIRMHRFEDAERLVQALSQRDAAHQKLPTLLYALGRTYLETGKRDKAHIFFERLQTTFPQTDEAKLSVQVMRF